MRALPLPQGSLPCWRCIPVPADEQVPGGDAVLCHRLGCTVPYHLPACASCSCCRTSSVPRAWPGLSAVGRETLASVAAAPCACPRAAASKEKPTSNSVFTPILGFRGYTNFFGHCASAPGDFTAFKVLFNSQFVKLPVKSRSFAFTE